MPRIRAKWQEYANADFLRELKRKKDDCGVDSDAELARLIGISASSICNRKKRPETFKVSELRGIVTALYPDPVAMLKFLGYPGKIIPDEIKSETK